MCKHVLNAQVSIRAPCCKVWFDCPQCHADKSDHELRKTTELVLACKKCKKVFRKQLEDLEEADEFCPHCDNHYVIEAKAPQQKKLAVKLEGDADMMDDRVKRKRHEDAKVILDLGKPSRGRFTDPRRPQF